MDSLHREIGKKKPFEHPEEEAFLNIARTASVLAADFDRLFKAAGLSESTYNILRILRGSNPEPRCPSSIGADLVAAVPDMTRLLDRLEKQALIQRERCTEDRRMVWVRITKDGLKVLAALDEPVLALHRQQLAHMKKDELRELSRLLVRARKPKGE
jgi:DNA-binding MarR family transcriptional regulator